MKTIGQFLFSLYLWIMVGVITCLVSSLILLSFPIAVIDPARRWSHWLGTVWAALLTRLNPFWRLKIVGVEGLRKGKGYVLVANHSSLADIACLFVLNHQFKWLAKKSLFKIPFLGWSMAVMGYIPLERGKYGSIRVSYQKALEWLEKGLSVLIFPEGTRSRSGEMGHFKSGAFRLALESGRPIVPIVLAGTEKIISKGKAAFGGSRLAYMIVLPPIETKGPNPEAEEELRKKVERLMSEELRKRNRMLARI